MTDRPNPKHYTVHRAFPARPSSTAPAEKSQGGDRKKLRQGLSGERSPGKPSSVIHVRSYSRPSWLTSNGANRKARMLERKGIPSMKNWRFITLTIDRKQWPCPLQAYLHGVEHMRRFLEACRKAKIWKRECKWAWKLEFHSDFQGYPHWHLVVEHRFKLTHRQLATIGKLWGMGRAKTLRILESKFGYGFKYALKPALREAPAFDGDDDFERLAPDWFLDYLGKKTVKVKLDDGESYLAEKPVTFKRVRFWQTSKGFYSKPPVPSKPAKPQVSWSVPQTVREKLHDDSTTVQVIARDHCGSYISAKAVKLSLDLERFWGLVGFDTMHGGALGLAVNSFVIPTHRIQTDKQTKWALQPLLTQNRLTLRQAARLRQRGETLRTC